MSSITEHIVLYFLIILSTIFSMLVQGFLPFFLFPGFNVVIVLSILVVLLEVICSNEEELSGYLGTFIGIFVGYFGLIFLGFSIQTLLKVPTALSIPHVSTISSVLELPIMSKLFIIEGLIIATVAIKIKLLFSVIFSE